MKNVKRDAEINLITSYAREKWYRHMIWSHALRPYHVLAACALEPPNNSELVDMKKGSFFGLM